MNIRDSMIKLSQVDVLERLNRKFISTEYEACCLWELFHPESEKDSTNCDKNCNYCMCILLNDEL